MEKHKCKLCLRKFANGRALGGHVRSHMINLYTPPKSKLLQEESSEEEEEEEEEEIQSLQSSSFFTSSEDEDEWREEEEEEEENSHKSSFLVDHEFNLAASSSVVQERESEESESSRNVFGKKIRSSRIISSANQFYNFKDSIFRQPICEKSGKSPEPLSSISETTPDEDIAYCLMMLSRDKWIKTEPIEKEVKNHTKDQFQDSGVVEKVRKSRGKYRCETCDKVFRSYQALGGHRASHKRIKLSNFSSKTEKLVAESIAGNFEEKIHKCAVCFKVFSSGQALGGHKRSHGAAATSLNLSSGKTFGVGKALIDLNLPAPIDDEDDNISQAEVEQFSVVSDDEFVNPIK